jgi:biotin transport system substrate-specific component
MRIAAPTLTGSSREPPRFAPQCAAEGGRLLEIVQSARMNLRLDRPGTLLTTLAAGAEMNTGIRIASVLLLAALTAAAAQVSIPLPFTPIPFTLQPMVVLLGGAVLGARLGLAAQVVYLLAGIAGFPVFAASATLPQGALRLIGPTGGYLMSYPFAAYLTGFLAEAGFDRRYVTSVVAMAAGLVIIFACGVLWLAFFARPAVGLAGALRSGLYPFIPADILKVLVAAAIMPAAWRLTRE